MFNVAKISALASENNAGGGSSVTRILLPSAQEWLRSCTPICREGIDGLERGGGCRADASVTACNMFSHSVRASSLRLCENTTSRNFINMSDHIRKRFLRFLAIALLLAYYYWKRFERTRMSRLFQVTGLMKHQKA
jgi:hypothetical protein